MPSISIFSYPLVSSGINVGYTGYNILFMVRINISNKIPLVDDFFEAEQEFIGRVVFDKGVFDNVKQHISRGETDIHILVQA